MPANIITGGTLTVELDVGFGDGFTLDDSQQGILNGTTFVLDGVDQFAEIDVVSVNIERGKKTVLDSIAPGRATIVARDTTRAFDPYNEASVYWDEFDDTPGLSPLRQIRITRNSTVIYRGRVVDFTYDYVGPKQLPQVTILAADDLFILANSFLNAFTPSAELSSARVSTILDRTEVGWSASLRDITTGTTTLGNYAIAEGTNALDYLRKIDAAERGRIFVRASDGDLVFQPRIGNTLSAPSVTFSDDGTNTPYRDVFVDFTVDSVLNRVTIQRPGGLAQTATDTASIALYFTQAETITDSLLSTDAQALTLANYLLEGSPEPRFSGVETFFGSLTTVQKNAVADVEIGETIAVTRTFTTGSPLTVTEELTVEGISHRIDLRGETVTFYTAPTTIVYPLILNDAIFGRLDANNALAEQSEPVIIDPEMITVGFDTTSTIADATTYYFGTVFDALTSTAQRRKIYFSQAGTITSADIFTYATTAGSADAWSLNIRLNDTTNYLVSTLSVSANERRFVNSSLAVPIAVNDYIELTLGPTTWTNNPISLHGGGLLRFQPA